MDRYKFTKIKDKNKYDITFYPIIEETETDKYIIAPK